MIHYIEYDPATGEGREIDPFKSPDLVAVVRCRNCKHFEYCQFHRHSENKSNGFCAWGERK